MSAKGQSLVEVALVLALIALIAIAVISQTGVRTKCVMSEIYAAFGEVMNDPSIQVWDWFSVEWDGDNSITPGDWREFVRRCRQN